MRLPWGIRQQLFPPVSDPGESRRQGGRVSRLLKRLHGHGLIGKIQHAHRWRVTHKGHLLMTTVLILHHERYPTTLHQVAA
jgi:hypothetical protein